jgi:RNA polymerase sigma-70 factor (sigma-E family)
VSAADTPLTLGAGPMGDAGAAAETRRLRVSPADSAASSVSVMETLGVVSSGTTAEPQGVAWVDALVAALFQAEGSRLVSLARLFVDDRTAAEDLVQEAFIRLARSAHRIRDEERAAAYLRSIVINLARDHNRRGLVSFRHRPPAVTDVPSAEEHAAESEGRVEVVEALRALPKRQRDCVALRYYLELSIPDIAATLGVSTNSVKTHLQRGLRSMAQTLEAKQ